MTEYESTAQRMWREAGMDILDKLKAEARKTRAAIAIDGRCGGGVEIWQEAADEIERLRAALKPFAFAHEQAEPHKFVSLHDLRVAAETLEEK